MKQHKVKPVEPDRTTIQHIEDGIDEELHASITGEYELPEGMTLEEFEEFGGGKLSDMSRETYELFLAQYHMANSIDVTEMSDEQLIELLTKGYKTEAPFDVEKIERLLGQIERGEVINLSAMTKEERRDLWSNKPIRSFECDSAVSCHKDDLPQDIKDRLHARKVQLADEAYERYLQAEKDGALITSTVEEHLAWLSIATGIDLAEMLEDENKEYIAEIKALRDHALQNSTNVTGMDWNEFLAALGRSNPPEN